MAKRYYQSKADRMDESLGMRRGKESTKQQSYKDRRDESMGMKKSSMKMKRNSPLEGSYDKMAYEYVSKTKVEDWGCPSDAYAMTQESNGSMDYLEQKDRLQSEDARRLRRTMLSQDGSKYR